VIAAAATASSGGGGDEGVRVRTGGSNVDIAAAPPSGQPVAMVLPDAVPRVGQPLGAIRSNDQVCEDATCLAAVKWGRSC
jgi:hypothetical protein